MADTVTSANLLLLDANPRFRFKTSMPLYSRADVAYLSCMVAEDACEIMGVDRAERVGYVGYLLG